MKNKTKTVDGLNLDLSDKLINFLLQGTKWTIHKIHYFFVECVSIRVSRGASYIPTPAPYNNAKCRLINIKNENDEELQVVFEVPPNQKGETR